MKMGLFHYLLIIKINKFIKNEEIEKFFFSKKFVLIEKSEDCVSLMYNNDVGNVEVLIDTDKEFSIRTKVQNEVKVIDIIILILQQFVEEMKSDITIYDVQNKQVLDLSNMKKIKELFLRKQNELKKYF